MDEILESFVAFSGATSFSDIPRPVIEAAKDRLVDALGCAIGAHATPTVEIVRKLAVLPASRQLAGRLIGSDDVVAGDSAGFINSTMIRALDFNDTYPGVHPSDCLGGLLGLGAIHAVSGRDLLVAMVVAYEIFIRLQMKAQFRERGWDQGAGVGSATAAALANLLRLDADTARHAISLATVGNMPLRATRAGQLSMWKGAATAYAVRNAVFSIQLAQLGMTGPEAPFTGRHGLTEQVSGPIKMPAFGTSTDDFFLPKAKLKYWPVAYNLQLAVWAGIELGKQVSVEDLESIEVETYWQAWSESGSEPAKWDPRTQGTADHSLPYIMARALRHGAVDAESFEPEAYLDPSIRPLMDLISVRVADDIQNEFPHTLRMRALARDRSGRTYRTEIVNPIGHETNPISREGVDEKFMRLCEPVLGAAAARRACNAWFDVESSDDIGKLMDLLNIPASSMALQSAAG